MAVTNNELQNKLASLKRTPCPNVPSETRNPLKDIKLKPVLAKKPVNVQNGNNDQNTEEPIKNIITNDDTPKKKRSLSVKEQLKILEGPGHAPKPKPPVSVKPTVAAKRPPSITDKPSAGIPEKYKDTRIPTECPLPPLSSLGDPPAKPNKLWSLNSTLKKYLDTTHPPRPISMKMSSEQENTTPSISNGPPLPRKPAAKPPPSDVVRENLRDVDENANSSHDDSAGIYDDTADVADYDDGGGIYDDTVDAVDNDVAGGIYDDTIDVADNDDGGGIYDDTVDVADNDQGGIYDDTAGDQEDATFGEELYEPIRGNEEPVAQNHRAAPPPDLPPANTEKKAKEHAKEEKKRKEREEKEKKKKEKEEKEREEKEKKKREKEKERKISEMKKKFGIRGNEVPMGTCCAMVDVAGNKWEIAASIGETFDIIRKDKPNPPDKWLVRNQLGQYGFIDINNIGSDQVENEDLYEDVNTVQQSVSAIQEEFPTIAAPTTSPPPPPNRNPSTEAQEIYDDIATGADEELYEPLDN